MNNIILMWLDIETTGLDYKKDRILEVAWTFTDYQGTEIIPITSSITARKSALRKLDKADEYVKNVHAENGLREAIRAGLPSHKNTLRETLENTAWVIAMQASVINTAHKEVFGEFPEIRLAGSSVHFDKRFMETQSKTFRDINISHRVHDMTTLRTFHEALGTSVEGLIKREGLEGLPRHRAAADVLRDVTQWRAVSQAIEMVGSWA